MLRPGGHLALRNDIEAVIRTVPFISTLGVSVEEARAGQVVLRLPFKLESQAAGGILHSGAMFTLGELAAAVAVGTHPKLQKYTRLQRATRIQYKANSSKDVTAHAMITAEMVNAVIEGVKAHGKAEIEIPVNLMDGHGKDVGEVVSKITFRA